MIGQMKKILLFLFLLAVLAAQLALLPGHSNPQPAFARPLLQGSGSDVIALVNSLRAANGLPLYKLNSLLMASAQAHSEYQAANQDTMRTGVDGSSAKDRAISAGFGGGAIVFVSENIASGVNMSPDRAVQVWQGDSQHLATLLSPSYTDAGAGVASDGKVTYITLDVGYIAGQEGSAQNPTSQTAQATSSITQTPTARPGKGFVIMPVVTVTPQADGSIIHIVQPGEVLLNIAVAYNLKLADLYKLNNLNEKSVIYPGEKIKIKGPDPTPTPTETSTPTRIPTATRRPTRTPTPTVFASPTLSVSSTVTNSPVGASRSSPDPLLIAIGVLFLVGISFVLAGSLLKKK